MKQPLYVVWNANHHLQVPIIDEQHHSVAAAINSLYFFIHQGWGLGSLLPTLKIVKANVAFHMKTEEGILERLGAGIDVISVHRALHQQFVTESNDAYEEALVEKDPMILLKFLRTWLVNHVAIEHVKYEELLEKIVVKPEED